MFICKTCNEEKPASEFDIRKDKKYGDSPRLSCKSCRAVGQRRRYLKYKTESYFTYRAQRAKRASTSKKPHLPFDLDASYLESIWVDYCPILGVKLERHTSRTDDNAAELDKLVPAKGYTKGNVYFLSRRANRLKNDASATELEAIAKWMRSVGRED